MGTTTATVRVPATSANLGPGFDALGVALETTGDVTVTWSDHPARFPESRADHLALQAARAVYQRAGRPVPDGLTATYRGDIPVGRGMGASAVLRVGAVVAANVVLGLPFDQEETLLIASELEGHADNVAPALLGGFQVCVWDDSGITHIAVPVPPELRAVVLVPDLDMPTSESRKLLPVSLTRQEAVHNIGRAALLVAAVATGRFDALATATADVLHQPARSRLFPEMFSVFDAARQAGALAAYLSGGGSSIVALTVEKTDAIGAAMLDRVRVAGRDGRIIQSRLGGPGARVLDGE